MRRVQQRELQFNGAAREDAARRGDAPLGEACLAGGLTFLCAFPFLLAFDLPYLEAPMITALVGLPLCFSLLLEKIRAGILASYLLFFLAAACALFYRTIWQGVLLLANGLGEGMGRSKGVFFLPFAEGSVQGQETLLGALALLPVVLLLSFLVALSIKKKLPLLSILLTALPLFFSLTFSGKKESLNPFLALLGLAWVYLLAWSALGRREKGSFCSAARGRQALEISLLSALCLAVILGAAGLILPRETYEAGTGTAELREALVGWTEDLRFETKAQMAAMPRGDVKNAGSFQAQDTPVMEVTMETPRSMYLRGFVGSVYEAGSWEELPAGSYGGKFTGIMEWLGQNGFYPQTQLGQAMEAAEDPDRARVSVKNLALSSKYAYAPYEALTGLDLSPDQANYRMDQEILSRGLRGQRTFTFETVLLPNTDYAAADLSPLLLSEEDQEEEARVYREMETLYRTFVYDAYLEVPEETDRLLQGFYTANALEGMKGLSYQEVAAALRKAFYQDFTFSYEAEKPGAGKEFLSDFLRKKEGYQIHFATLAALLFREAGIPARYAEGFYITPGDVSIYTEMESIVFPLTDASAHAWTEVYADGVGWLPIEVTPGFYPVEEDPQSADGTTDVLEENPSYFYLKDQEAPIEEEETPAEEERKAQKAHPLLGLLVALALLLLAAALFLLLRRRTIRKRRESFDQEDGRQAALAMFRYGVRLLRLDGMKADAGLPAGRIGEEAGERYDFSESQKLLDFVNLAYKARYRPGEEPLTREELEKMKGYLEVLSREIHKRQKGWKKMYIKLL